MSSALRIALSGLQDAAFRALNAAENIVKASSTIKLSEKNSTASRSAAPADVITVSQSRGDSQLGVTSQQVSRNPAFVTAYDPQSSLADAEGLVAVPNVDIGSEIVSLTIASTIYRANAFVARTVAKTDEALVKII